MSELTINYDKDTVKLYGKYIEVLDPNTNSFYKIKYKDIIDINVYSYSKELRIEKSYVVVPFVTDYHYVSIKFDSEEEFKVFYEQIKNPQKEASEKNSKTMKIVIAFLAAVFIFSSVGLCSLGDSGSSSGKCKNCGRSSVYSMGFCRSCYNSFYDYTYGNK